MSNNKVFVNLNVKELVASGNNAEVATKASGTIIDRRGIRTSYAGNIYYSPNYLIDDNEGSYSYVKEGATYYFTFPKVRLVKSVVIKTVPGYGPKSLGAYAAMAQGDEQFQGTVDYNGSGDLVITFKKAVPLLRFSLSNFVLRDDASSDWMGFSEINFYEE